MVGYGALSLVNATSSLAMVEGLQVIGAAGLGVLQVASLFGVLAPLPVSDNALALALLTYVRSIGQCVTSHGSHQRHKTLSWNLQLQNIWHHHWDNYSSKRSQIKAPSFFPSKISTRSRNILLRYPARQEIARTSALTSSRCLCR